MQLYFAGVDTMSVLLAPSGALYVSNPAVPSLSDLNVLTQNFEEELTGPITSGRSSWAQNVEEKLT